MMLGTLVTRLGEPGVAEATLVEAGDLALLARLQEAALAEGVDIASFASRSVRHFLDHAGDEDWLQLMGVMGRSEQPGLVALQAILENGARHAQACCAGPGPAAA